MTSIQGQNNPTTREGSSDCAVPGKDANVCITQRSPVEGRSAPHSQEAASPSQDAKTGEGEDGGPIFRFSTEMANEAFLRVEMGVFDDIIAWHHAHADEWFSRRNSNQKGSRKRKAEDELEPEVKRLIQDAVDCSPVNIPHQESPKAVPTMDNPLRRMELMTNSPVFDPLPITTQPRKISKSEKIGHKAMDGSIPHCSPLPTVSSPIHSPSFAPIPSFPGRPIMVPPHMSPAFQPLTASPLASPSHPFPPLHPMYPHPYSIPHGLPPMSHPGMPMHFHPMFPPMSVPSHFPPPFPSMQR